MGQNGPHGEKKAKKRNFVAEVVELRETGIMARFMKEIAKNSRFKFEEERDEALVQEKDICALPRATVFDKGRFSDSVQFNVDLAYFSLY